MLKAKRRVSSRTVRLEQDQLDQLQLQLVAAVRPPRKLGPEFSDFASRFIQWAHAERQKPSSLISKASMLRLYLTPRFAGRRLGDVGEHDVLELKQQLAGRSAKTVCNCLTVLRKMLKLAVRWGELDAMPLQIDSPKVDRPRFEFYDFEVYEQLVAGARKVGRQQLAMTLLAGDAGLRMGEVIALQWADVDVRRRELAIRRSEWQRHVTLPKGGRSRAVPMTELLARALEQLESRGPDQRVLVRDTDGGRLSYQGVRNWMRKAQRAAGMPINGRLHVLRHTFCSHLAMRGAAAVAIRELAGHTNLQTTERYMHLAPAQRSKTIGLLDAARAESSPATRESL